ncbi:hypothetical protein, variant [Aphanomyces astaci]|uniref:Uncharacterized protein n=1 Tax=Aphanomyces astaci TaxID=112090 RepID=W4FT73_APHAT|nr:hypothetical protein, variant [Aphanomyces astaci]ETV69858.1 hypothetical protein, variant [Aphanomyces astaci]|eukprot:XP_009840595.1 hypothetical protein, variant [Aphanomyces astaci]
MCSRASSFPRDRSATPPRQPRLRWPIPGSKKHGARAATTSSRRSCTCYSTWTITVRFEFTFDDHVLTLGVATVDVNVVFRTFGDDIVEVAKEIEFLVHGRHPLFPGKALSASMRLEPPYATFYRDGFEASGTALALNTLQKVPFQSTNSAATPVEFYASIDPAVSVVRGFEAVQQCIQSMLSTRSVIALRDYWEWWSTHAEHAEYGKLLLIDGAVPAVFFDDHVEECEAHIVDVRDAVTGLVVPFQVAKLKYLRRVEPYYAITDVAYYTKHVDALVVE